MERYWEVCSFPLTSVKVIGSKSAYSKKQEISKNGLRGLVNIALLMALSHILYL